MQLIFNCPDLMDQRRFPRQYVQCSLLHRDIATTMEAYQHFLQNVHIAPNVRRMVEWCMDQNTDGNNKFVPARWPWLPSYSHALPWFNMPLAEAACPAASADQTPASADQAPAAADSVQLIMDCERSLSFMANALREKDKEVMRLMDENARLLKESDSLKQRMVACQQLLLGP